MTRRSLDLLVVLLVAGLLICGCGGGGDDASTVRRSPAPNGPRIRIGAKNFTEQAILGELYSRALRAKGFDVVLKSDVGSSEISTARCGTARWTCTPSTSVCSFRRSPTTAAVHAA
jgi:osmoprotectant transport system substrate-binding protein